MSIIDYLTTCVSYMYEIMLYLQAPKDEGETAKEADYNAILAEINKRVLYHAQFNRLPKYFLNAFED